MLGWIIAVQLLLLLSAIYVGRRLIPPSFTRAARVACWLGVLLMVASLPLQFMFRTFWFTHGHSWVIQTLQYASGLYAIVFAMTVLRDLFLLLGNGLERLWTRSQQGDATFQPYALFEQQNQRRAFLRESTRWGVGLLSIGAFGRAAVDADGMSPTVVNVDVPLRGLPTALDGVRIVQISDVHIGQIRHEARLVAELVALVNTLNADIIALTGDMTDGTVAQLRERVAPLAQLQARYGRYFVTGNHEYYSDDPQRWIDEWARLGFSTLSNRFEVLNIRGADLVVAGVYDLKAGKRHATQVCSPQAALRHAPDAPTILLAHHPDTALLTHDVRVDLQLSGHTHGGQFFPGTWVVRWVHDFKPGLTPYGRGWVYVNSGTGYWGPALRSTDVLSEVTVLTLRAAA